MTAIKQIKKMLAIEQQLRAREDKEVTVDYVSVRAELRAECLEEVLKILA